MKVRIKTLSPVHIGSGAEIGSSEYVIRDGFFYRIDMDSLFQDPEFRRYSGSFIRDAISGTRSIIELLSGDVALALRHILYKLPLSLATEKSLKDHPLSVREQIKSAGRAFLPGSSLKGSLLSAVLFHVLREQWKSESDKSKIRDIILSQGKPVVKAFEHLLNYCFPIFTRRQGSGKFRHWLDVTDSGTRAVENTLQVFFGRTEGSSRPLIVAYEAIRPGVEFSCTILPDRGLVYSPEDLLRRADTFYKKVREKTGSAVQIPQGAYLMRVGQGSGAYSTSLLIFAEDVGLREYRWARKPRTRKLADGQPMGWIAITPDSSNE